MSYFSLVSDLAPGIHADEGDSKTRHGEEDEEARRVWLHDDFSVQSKKHIKKFSGWFKAAVPSNIVKAFRRAGITSLWLPEAGELICFVERGGTSQVPNWKKQKSPRRPLFGVIKPLSKLIQRIRSVLIWDGLTDRLPIPHGSGEE
jgi:hypothetical protein